jgi:hypothetical protein
LHTAFKANEISREDFVESMSLVKDECYILFHELVERRLGFIPERLTKLIEKEPSAF